jgi:hypothetical protein
VIVDRHREPEQAADHEPAAGLMRTKPRGHGVRSYRERGWTCGLPC